MSTDSIPSQAPSIPDQARRQKLLNIFVPLTLSLIFAVLTIEFGLRKFYQLIPLDVCAADHLIGTYDCQPYFIYDRPIRIGYRYQPGFRLEGMWDPADPHLANSEKETAPTGRSDAFPYLFETDEMGFPNSEYEWKDQYDIIITGDSFTIRTAPRTWIELLGQQTGKSILTLGAPSWSTLNEVEAIKLYGLDKNPEWVILMYFEGNDLINVGQYLERLDSGLNWKEYDLRGVPFTRRMITPHLINYFINQTRAEKEETIDYRYPVAASTEVGLIETVFKDIHLLPLSASYETLARSNEFAEVRKRLLEIDRLVREQDGRFLLVYIPAKEHVLWSRIWDPVDVDNILERTVTVTLSEGDHGSLQWNTQYLSYATFNQNHNAQERLLDDFTRENGIEFLNLTPIFWQESIARGELYHYADPHWNQAGNLLVADTIYEYIGSH